MKVFNISLQFGILVGILLILYFLILGVLGVNDQPIYSFANPIMMAVGISLAIRKAEMKYGELRYHKGFELGIYTGVIATVLFSIFFISYYVYNPQFSRDLVRRIGENYASTGAIFITVFIMGIVTAMITSFFLMQLHKRKIRRNPND